MSDSKMFTITIKVKGGTHEIHVKDDGGNEKKCDSIVLAAGCSHEKQVYLFAWGHPGEAAWSLGEGLAQAQGNPWYESFLSCHCRDMAMRTMPVGKPTTIENLEKRWSEEDEAEAKKVTSH